MEQQRRSPAAVAAGILPPELLERVRSRAAGYDESNSFFDEDLADLRDAGYLTLFTPREEGGHGLGIAEAAECQRLLAGAAPATALALNMHLVWCGVAYLLARSGDDSLAFILREAAAGEVFAFGISEPGNPAVLFDSRTTARPTGDGGYAFTGRKIFTSLAPAWTRLGLFGRDDTDPANPRLVFGFADRGTPGISSPQDWNTLGMRASQSRSTILDEAAVPAGRMVRSTPVGPHDDRFVFAIFALFSTLLSAVYTGIGDRAVQLAVEAAGTRRSGGSAAADPYIRWRVADAAMAMDGVRPQVAAMARDLDEGADHGALWFPRLSGLKVRVVETARDVVVQAVKVAGGQAYSRGSEVERLYRDVLAGIFHPTNEDAAHASMANALLGPVED